MWYPARLVSGVPLVFSVGAVHESVAEPVAGLAGAALTAIVNGPIDELPPELVAVIVMPALVPTLAAAGVPVNAPVVVLKAAQAGFPWI